MTGTETDTGRLDLVDSAQSVLVIVDAQERLAAAMHDKDAALARISLLGQAAGVMKVPVLTTEQYPKGLGHTVPLLRTVAQSGRVIEKTEFGIGDIEEVRSSLEDSGRRQILLTGFEAHVCVFQSAVTLARLGYRVFVAADAISSRKPADRDAAIARLLQAGIAVVTSEMIVFEWLRAAGTPGFKELSRLVR